MVNKQKVLIVDDDNNIAELISLYLTKECFETMMVYDGESVMGAIASFEPNLILLDLMLPGIDGYQVCNWERTIIWKNHSIPRNWWPGSRQCCAGTNLLPIPNPSPGTNPWNIPTSPSTAPITP